MKELGEAHIACINFNGDLINPPSKVGPEWLITLQKNTINDILYPWRHNEKIFITWTTGWSPLRYSDLTWLNIKASQVIHNSTIRSAIKDN